MRRTFFILMLAVTTILPMGCSTGFRVGGPRAGISAGGAVGPSAAPIVIDNGHVPQPPLQ